jgi:hypothetical protein
LLEVRHDLSFPTLGFGKFHRKISLLAIGTGFAAVFLASVGAAAMSGLFHSIATVGNQRG